jgi:hypothetical protein
LARRQGHAGKIGAVFIPFLQFFPAEVKEFNHGQRSELIKKKSNYLLLGHSVLLFPAEPGSIIAGGSSHY